MIEQENEPLDPDAEILLERILTSVADYCEESGMTKEETQAVINNEQVRSILLERGTIYFPVCEDRLVVVTSICYDELQCSQIPKGLLS